MKETFSSSPPSPYPFFPPRFIPEKGQTGLLPSDHADLFAPVNLLPPLFPFQSLFLGFGCKLLTMM